MIGDGEQVRLVMPAAPELLRVARLTAAGLASRLGFSFDEVEDVKIAVDELCFALVGTKGMEGTLTLVYQLQADSLVIEGTGDFPGQDVRATTGELSTLILSAVVDSHEVTDGDGTVRFKLTKRRSPRP
ncbi:MAG: anti-sigma regulatory factor [Acidimicrobiia bacterium]|nr:anti-sigma regulatory factor [Acidimicrobiia bacterium]